MCASQTQLSPAPEAFGLHSAFGRTVAHWGGRISKGATMKVCSIKGCGRPRKGRKLCSAHLVRISSGFGLKPHIPIGKARIGKLNPRWLGGASKNPTKWMAIQWRRYPEKMAARAALRMAVRWGRITRKPCHKCGNLKSESHHRDYSKPLEVVWLCRKHHRNEHVKEGNI